MPRTDGRAWDQAREATFTPGFVRTADGSCLVAMGGTRVICTATVDEQVPPFLAGKGTGWLTAEYAMLPASTGRRKQREGLKRDGRSVEIQRLIGRSLRAALDMRRLGSRCIHIDCDVLEADGGTRTASITGGFVALALCVDKLMRAGKLYQSPIIGQVAAISAGLCDNVALVDLCYEEDSRAQVDMNLVMDADHRLVELQGTGEGRSFSRDELLTILDAGTRALDGLMQLQRQALGEAAGVIAPLPRLLVASGNAHKIAELRAMLGDRYDVAAMRDVGVTQEAEETGATFEENAALKAELLCRLTGCASVADDSGLMVDALDGEPGVHSARYCGVHGQDAQNNALLLERLRDVPEPRTARFVSVLALARPGRETLLARGVCEGTILRAGRGTGGFGYDPLFLYKDKTFAEMGDEKLAISHRANAMRALKALLDEERV